MREVAANAIAIVGSNPVSGMTIKMINDTFNEDRKEAYNTFVYGTKEAGVNIAKAIRMNKENKFHLRGFVADDPAMRGKVMMGVNVYMNDDALIDNVRKNDVQAIIVSPAKAEKIKETDIVDRLIKENVRKPSDLPMSRLKWR